jgi:cytosine/uracil/thiamine/allantoin permease
LEEKTMSVLPAYVASAQRVPQANRAPWYKNTAPTYAGIMLWFVFWQDIVKGGGESGGVLSMGVVTALIGLAIAALLCHFLFYLAPAKLGMQTGLPLYVVGTSTYGVTGGLFMPGFLMGLLQFGWLAVNAMAVSTLFCECMKWDSTAPSLSHGIVAAIFAIACAFVGLKGIGYVARVATYLPLIPLIVLLILLVKTIGGASEFTPAKIIGEANAQAIAPLSTWGVLAILCTYVVGFFATAGAAGADIASNNRDNRDVQLGGLAGITLATFVAGGAAILIVAGIYGAGLVNPANQGNCNPITLMKDLFDPGAVNTIMILLAISSFPAACFSAFIAANCFKTTMPNVNPSISVGIGTLIAVVLAVTGIVGKVIGVFVVIGAAFGPVCGAMAADYLLSGRKWAGPRAGFNPAGWISWIVGFAVGAFNLVADWIPAMADYRGLVPVPPVAAFVVGFVLYFLCAKLGLESKKLDMPATNE